MTPDQEKELQKAGLEELGYDNLTWEEVSEYMNNKYDSEKVELFIAGAKHQDAISRKDMIKKVKETIINKIVTCRQPNNGMKHTFLWFSEIEQVLHELETGESK